jgi:hypothetical protein
MFLKLDKKLLTILILTIIIGIIPLRNAIPATNLGTAISPFGLDPTIDAKFETAEWIDSSIYYYQLYKIDNQLDTMDLYFRTTYSATNLTFSITVYDSNTAGSELIIVYFKVNTTGDLLNINGGDPYFENGNDAKAVWYNNYSKDCHSEFSEFNAYFDTNNPGGTDDIFGKVGITNNVKMDFEITMLLDSGDIPESYDIALEARDTVEIFFWYYDNTGYYSGYRDTDLDYNYYILELFVPPDPVTVTPPPETITITPPPETITQNNTITTTVEIGIIFSSIIVTAIIGITTITLFLRKRRK